MLMITFNLNMSCIARQKGVPHIHITDGHIMNGLALLLKKLVLTKVQ
jgi:hypothetical protein